MGKAELLRPPLAWLLRRMHGIAIRRGSRSSVVTQMVAAFYAGKSGLHPENAGPVLPGL